MPGIKDEGLLESALHRPQQRWHYGKSSDPPDLFDLAAAYAYGIARNHGFHDGNKRTAAASCLLFLRVNGTELDVLQPELVTVFVDLANGRASESELAHWLRVHQRKPAS